MLGAGDTTLAKQTQQFFWNYSLGEYIVSGNKLDNCTTKYKLQEGIGAVKEEYKKPRVCVRGGHSIILELHCPTW